MGKSNPLPFGGVKVWRKLTSDGFMVVDGVIGNGPYASIDMLIKFSPIIQEIRKKYGDKYKVVLEEKNISTHSETILIPPDKQFHKGLPDLVMHATKGDVNRYESTGGHLLHKDKVRISQLIDTDNKGVMKAYIEIFDYKNNKWVSKKLPSTLFPKTWDMQKFFNECTFCFENRKYLEDDKYTATTTSGIKTIVVVQGDKPITFYPIFENSK